MRLVILASLAAISLAGCVVKQDPPISDDVLAASVYRHDGPPRLTLFTMVYNRSGRGAHSALMINGSQQVIFDPAGSFRTGGIISHDDVVYNATPALVDIFTRFHARETHHVVVQELDVSAEVAEQALQLAQARGEVPDALCAHSISTLLSKLPGLEGINTTWFPKPLSVQFDQLDGVRRSELYEYDDGDRFKALEAFEPERVKANMKANGV